MRSRVATAALGVLLLALAPAGTALAAQEGEEAHLTEEQTEELRGSLSEEEFECVEEQATKVLAAEEGRGIQPLDTCEESPNPILPATNELIWAVISFTVLLVVLAKFAFPALKRGLEGREEAVRSDLEAAEKARTEAQGALSEYRRQIADARNEAATIIEEARQASDAMRRELQESAESEMAAARERAQGEIEQMASRARADLQAEMADFSVRLAERIVEHNLDRAAQQGLIDRYIAEVGAMSGNGSTGNGGTPGGD